jgi:hypothetical protein
VSPATRSACGLRRTAFQSDRCGSNPINRSTADRTVPAVTGRTCPAAPTRQQPPGILHFHHVYTEFSSC